MTIRSNINPRALLGAMDTVRELAAADKRADVCSGMTQAQAALDEAMDALARAFSERGFAILTNDHLAEVEAVVFGLLVESNPPLKADMRRLGVIA